MSSVIPTIQVAATAGILEYTAAGGGDVAWVIHEAKLTLEDLSRPEQRLPLRKFVTLIETASRATGDDCFGAHLGQICGLRELGLPGYLATFAPNVERALSSFARYYYLLGDSTDVRFEQRDGRASFTYHVLDRESWPRRQDSEQVITMIVYLIRDWIGPTWKPDAVWFEHDQPANAAELELILGCPLRFNRETNTVWFDQASAEHKNPKADERLFHLLSWFAETVTGSAPPSASQNATFRDQVIACIETCANLGSATIVSVSRALGLEARTFQRRLVAENSSFRELFETYLQRESRKLLARSDLGEKEIAARLGYGSLNSFIRAFRRWNGVTPGEWRVERAAMSRLVSSAVPRLS
ncbi:MAG TPA: AraC family transcriptional regulator [Polyangiaceae bacterium]